ncbi:MAG: NAD-dependent epimerase/dehydratase family protein [Chitinophagales bacterium]
MKPTRILITGVNGQIGSVLKKKLSQKFGAENIFCSDIKLEEDFTKNQINLDVLDRDKLFSVVEKFEITQIYHLAALLSGVAEQKPQIAWRINTEGLIYVLEAAKIYNLDKIFAPSSIAVFGSGINKENTVQDSPLNPSSVYGISKVADELWHKYYYEKHGVDVRSIRYPGIIGYSSLPGGGTTDWAVEIFHEAVKNNSYNCFLNKDTKLPMILMQDAIKATLDIMDAPKEAIKLRTSYNLASESFSPEEIAALIKAKYNKDFTINYSPDFRQSIADSWPKLINDLPAKKDWNWQAEYNTEKMVEIMYTNIEKQYKEASFAVEE